VTVLAVRIDCVTRSREQPSLLIVVQRWKDVCGAHPSCVTSKATTGYPVYNSNIRGNQTGIRLHWFNYCFILSFDAWGWIWTRRSFHVGQLDGP
jgi:hypothetical protein